jgi:hypothetical protein
LSRDLAQTRVNNRIEGRKMVRVWGYKAFVTETPGRGSEEENWDVVDGTIGTVMKAIGKLQIVRLKHLLKTRCKWSP